MPRAYWSFSVALSILSIISDRAVSDSCGLFKRPAVYFYIYFLFSRSHSATFSVTLNVKDVSVMGLEANHVTSCHQTKYWLDVPGSMGDTAARLDCPTLSIVLQALTGHNYLNCHHYIDGEFSEQICRFCGEEVEEFIHLACECSALTMECFSSVQGLQLGRQPPDLYGLVRLTQVSLASHWQSHWSHWQSLGKEGRVSLAHWWTCHARLYSLLSA